MSEQRQNAAGTEFGVARDKSIVGRDHDTVVSTNSCFLSTVDEQQVSTEFIPTRYTINLNSTSAQCRLIVRPSA